jgi:hypothetical protein
MAPSTEVYILSESIVFFVIPNLTNLDKKSFSFSIIIQTFFLNGAEGSFPSEKENDIGFYSFCMRGV